MKKEGIKFGRDIILLFIGFVLTTCVGRLLQDRSWEKQHRENLRQLERVAAEKVFSEVSDSMDDMLYRMNSLIDCYERGDKKAIEEKWIAYNEGRLDWGKCVNKNFALISRYYGNNASDAYRRDIHNYFNYIDFRIMALKSHSVNIRKEMPDIRENLFVLSDRIYKFDVRLLNSLKKAKIGMFIESKP